MDKTMDSDCEIQEPHISIITIADSEDGALENHVISSDEGEIEDDKIGTNNDDSIKTLEENCAEEVVIVEEVEEPHELFTVNFHSKQIFQDIGHIVLSALQTALENACESIKLDCTPNENSICLRAFRRVGWEADTEGAPPPPLPTIESETVGIVDAGRTEKEQSPDLSDLGALFTIDTEPTEKIDTIQVPSYKRTIKDVLNEESAAQKRTKNAEDVCTRIRPTTSCFNCGSTQHALRDCRKPRNNKRIAKAKKTFGAKSERYHVDVEQRFAHLRPGLISDKLQTALGLKRGQIPFFFYRMRILGYPPGWLEDAKVSHSGITLFNSDGNAVLEPQIDEGEVDHVFDHKYDVSKIVDFPGFNLDPGKNFFDDFKFHNVPPLNYTQLKENFIRNLGDNIVKGYKRKKLVDIPAVAAAVNSSPGVITNEADLATLEVTDMEIEDVELDVNVEFSRPMPPAEPEPAEKPPPPPPPFYEITPSPEERSESPTLEDLEAQQEKLLQELQCNASTLSDLIEDSLIDEVLELERTQDSVVDVRCPAGNVEAGNTEQCEPATPTMSKQQQQPSSSSPPSPQQQQQHESTVITGRKSDLIKESHMGTPILKFSPFDKLPDGENFKAGVSDVIYFENLPDSTGKYKQMKVVINKVRNIITQLNNEDD